MYLLGKAFLLGLLGFLLFFSFRSSPIIRAFGGVPAARCARRHMFAGSSLAFQEVAGPDQLPGRCGYAVPWQHEHRLPTAAGTVFSCCHLVRARDFASLSLTCCSLNVCWANFLRMQCYRIFNSFRCPCMLTFLCPNRFSSQSFSLFPF